LPEMRYKPFFTVAALFAAAGAQSPSDASDSSHPTSPSNSTGFRIQHGFETVLVQPFGFDGFRARAWPFRPPNGNEISFLYDPPLEAEMQTIKAIGK
jgi:hypothetical protein